MFVHPVVCVCVCCKLCQGRRRRGEEEEGKEEEGKRRRRRGEERGMSEEKYCENTKQEERES